MHSKVGTDKRLNYYLESDETVIQQLNSHREGLTNPEAERRLAQNGYHRLAPLPRATPLTALYRQMVSWQTASLVAATMLSWQAFGDTAGLVVALFGLLVISLNSWREQHHTSLAYNLEQLLPTKATVMRSSVETIIDSQTLVVGDVISLQHGDVIPADVRLISERHFTTDDHALTGSHQISHKYIHTVSAELPIAQRHNLALAGTTVASGSARGIVIATGLQTEIGRIASLAYSTPLQQSAAEVALRQHSHRLFIGLVGFAALVYAAHWSDWFPAPLTETLLAVTAVAASLGSFSLASAWLSWRTRRQAARHDAKLTKASAATNLAAVDTLLLDEEDFLVDDSRSIQELRIGTQSYTVTGESYEPSGAVVRTNGRAVGKKTLQDMALFFEAAAFTSRASLLKPDAEHASWHVAGPEEDGLLLALAHKATVDSTALHQRRPEQAHHKYDHARQLTSTVHQYDHRTMLFVRGTAQTVLARATRIWDGGHTRQLSASERHRLTEYYDRLATEGRHVVALAYRTLRSSQRDDTDMDALEQDLTLLGSVAIDQMIRADVASSLRALEQVGIRISLLSNRPTQQVSAGAANLGLPITTVIAGHQLPAMADQQIAEVLAEGAAFTHVSPEDRLRLVDIARSHREYVAITGSGLACVPALLHASVGIADARAVAAVTDEAGIQLKANDLRALEGAIDTSRAYVRALRTSLMVSLSDAAALVWLVLIGMALYLLWRAPVSVVPLLAVGLLVLTPFSLAGLISTRTRQRRPVGSARTFRGLSVTLSSYAGKGLLAAIFATVAFYAYFAFQKLTPDYVPSSSSFALHAATITFVSLVMMQLVNTWFDRNTVHRQPSHRLVLWIGLSLTLTACVVYVPALQRLAGSYALTSLDWVIAVSSAAAFAAMRWAIQHEHKHSRHSIIQLHHKVHGRDSGAKI